MTVVDILQGTTPQNKHKVVSSRLLRELFSGPAQKYGGPSRADAAISARVVRGMIRPLSGERVLLESPWIMGSQPRKDRMFRRLGGHPSGL